MTKAMFVMSTGRCSTQFLAHTLESLGTDVTVEHEPIGPQYRPRLVYRKPGKLFDTLGRHVPIQRKLIEIEDQVAGGRRYVDVGWPTFAWLDYLAGRFGAAFEFVHLVRNPFPTAASLLTHGFFSDRKGLRAKTGVIHGTDRNVLYPQFAADYDAFTPYEKALYHWLEVNACILGAHGKPGFRGLFRFEDLFSGDATELERLATTLLGQKVTGLQTDPYDQHSGKLKTEIDLGHEGLIDEVTALSLQLGYSKETLQAAMDTEKLVETYSRKRVAKSA